MTFASVNAQTALTGSDQECQPIATTKCGCGMIFDQKTGECIQGTNKYECICSQANPGGGSDVGTCDPNGVCKDKTTNGKLPSSVTPQQMLTNSGNSANGTSAGISGGTPQVSSNPGITVPQTSSPASPVPEQTNTESPNNPGVSTGSSLLNSAYQWLTGQDNSSPQAAQPSDNSSANSQSTGEPSWLSGAQQYQIQSEVSPPSGNPPTNVTSGGVPNANEGTTFQSNAGMPMGNLPISSQDLQNIQAANASVNLTPTQQAAQDLQAIQDTAKSVGGWVQSTLFPTNQQATGELEPGNMSNVRATIYVPGSGGYSGGVVGSSNNYLNPNIPTVAAGFSSPYQYGDVLSITNPSTGQTINAVVGDTCPGCGNGIDLTPAAANPIGFTLEQGVGNMQVGVVASTGSYAAGAQLASAMNEPADPWAGSSTNLSSVSSSGLPGILSVNDFASQSVAGAQYQQQFAVVDTGPTPAEPIPTGTVTQGPDLGQPYPAGAVTSAPLPLSDQQVAAQIPVPEQVQTNPQAAVEAANQLDNQNAQAQILNDRLAQADQETNAFNNPSMPKVDTNVPSGEAVTENVYNGAIAGASNDVPVPTAAEANLPTQAEMQADLLKNGQDFSSLNANSFYQTVEGNQFAEPGVAAPSGTVTSGPELGQPYPAGNVTSAPLPVSEQQVESQIPVPEQVQTNPQAAVEATNQSESQSVSQAENSVLNDRLAQADQETNAFNAFNNPTLPPVETNVPDGQTITQQVFDSAVADAAKQQQPLAEQGPANPSGTVESAGPLEPAAPNNQADIQAAETAQLQARQDQATAEELAFSKETALAQPQVGFTPNSAVGLNAIQAGQFGGVPSLEAVPTGAVTSAPIQPATSPLQNQNEANSFYDSVKGPEAPQTPQSQEVPSWLSPFVSGGQTNTAVTSLQDYQTTANQVSLENTQTGTDQIVTPEAHLVSALADTPTNLPSWATTNNTGAALGSVSAVTPQNLQQTANDFSSGKALNGLDQSAAIENPPLPQPRPTLQSSYSGSSIVNYLSSAGQDFSYAARAALAASQGIANYVGSAVQNLQLLKSLRGF